jgi:peptide alpha-N-acetyltransferase
MSIEYKNFSRYEDVLAVHEFFLSLLSEPYGYFTFTTFFIHFPDHCFLAFQGDTLVGAVMARMEIPQKGYIGMLGVSERYRRRGIATNLIGLVVDSFVRKKISYVYLETEVDNKSSLKLYEKLGFIRANYYEKYYLHLKDAYKLRFDNSTKFLKNG